MTLGEKIREQRTKNALSQESVAAMLGVSRQAVTKWESNQSVPSSDHLISLARIFHISVDELICNRDSKQKKPNTILRSNLTLLAIALQAGFLHSYAMHYYTIGAGHAEPGVEITIFNLLPLLLCSIWMASNHRFEPDARQRRKNISLELAYCLIQLCIAFLTMRYGMGLAGLLLTLAICLIYILIINPRYMKRKFAK